MSGESKKDEFVPAGIGEERIILDFRHIPGGKNCQTSALWKILHHYDLDITEEMLVGVGAGLGFVYWHQKGMPAPIVGGMNSGPWPGLIGRIIRVLGGDYEALKSSSVRNAHGHLKQTLHQGQPALVCADIAYLPHMAAGEDDHFGQHTFLVYGIDEAEDLAYLSDRFADTLTIPLIQLQKARASKFHPFPARNQMIRFQMPEHPPDLSSVIPKAIRDNADFMFNAPIRNLGLRGILKWRDMLPKYPKIIPNPKQLISAMAMHYIFIETGGSGGAIFRRIYSTFLREASELMEDEKLAQASAEFAGISDLWTKIAEACLPDDFPSLAEIRKIHWQNNVDFEEKGSKATASVSRRAERIPPLLDQAAKEAVPAFQKIIEPIREMLVQVHAMESAALMKLKAVQDSK